MLFPCKVKWVATAVTLCGALATALMFDPLNIWLPAKHLFVKCWVQFCFYGGQYPH
jgi:hypothetical protein